MGKLEKNRKTNTGATQSKVRKKLRGKLKESKLVKLNQIKVKKVKTVKQKLS